MNFGKAFSYVFEDPDWIKKVLLAGLVSLIPLVGQIYLIGWMLEITRRVIYGDPQPLPEINFGSNLGRGFKGFVVTLAYALPLIVFGILFGIVAGATSNSNGDMSAIGMLATGCFTLFAIFYGIILGLLMPAAMGRLAATDQMGPALRLGEVFAQFKAAPGAHLMVLLGAFVSSFIASLGSVACGIGLLLTMPYAMAVNGHLYGQAHREAANNASAAVMSAQRY